MWICIYIFLEKHTLKVGLLLASNANLVKRAALVTKLSIVSIVTLLLFPMLSRLWSASMSLGILLKRAFECVLTSSTKILRKPFSVSNLMRQINCCSLLEITLLPYAGSLLSQMERRFVSTRATLLERYVITLRERNQRFVQQSVIPSEWTVNYILFFENIQFIEKGVESMRMCYIANRIIFTNLSRTSISYIDTR